VYNCCGTPDLVPYSINFFSYEDSSTVPWSPVETEETPESKEGYLDTPEPAAKRDIQIEYTCY